MVSENPLNAFHTEDEAGEIRDVKKRALRDERRKGLGPPYIVLNRKVFYPKAAFKAWLESLTIQPARSAQRPYQTGTVLRPRRRSQREAAMAE